MGNKGIELSFNPCFNGTLVASYRLTNEPVLVCQVSILVLMEPSSHLDGDNTNNELNNCFNPCFNGTLVASFSWLCLLFARSCFNPCFNGTLVASHHCRKSCLITSSFNPCF